MTLLISPCLVLTHTGDWALKRGIKLSEKSVAVILSANPASLQQVLQGPQLHIQGLILPWVEQFAYLGHPLLQYKPGRRRAHVHVPHRFNDMPKRLHALGRLFTTNMKSRVVHIKLLVIGIKQVIFPMVLYPSCVVPVQQECVDEQLRKWLKHFLQLPPTTPTAFLRWGPQL